MIRALPLLLVVAACTGKDDSDTDTGDTGVASTCPDIPELFEQKCELCHSGEDASAGLDLVSAGWENGVIDVEGQLCEGVLADPARPSESLLYTKLFEEPDCGARMPQGGDAFTEHEMRCVRDWIAGLVPTDTDTGEDCPECECEPDEVESCYTGPDDTLDVGICLAGERLCDPEGFWGPCEDQVLPRSEDCRTTDVDEDCDGETPVCTSSWVAVFGGEDSQVGRSIAVDSQGHSVMLGDFAGTVAFGDRTLTADGDKQDYVLVKLDEYGNVLWAERFGDSSNQWATQVTVAPNDDIVVAGRAFGKIDFGGGEHDGVGTDDVVVARFDESGAYLWSTMVGGLDPDRTESVVVHPITGDVILTGAFTGTASFGGSSLTSRGFRDGFILQLDGETGATDWVIQVGGEQDDHAFSVDVGGDGSLYVAGRFNGTADFAGTELTSAGGTDMFLMRLQASGAVTWTKRFGGEGEDRVDAVLVDDAGRLVLAGYTDGTVDFGGGALTTAGSRDIVLVGLDASGNHRWSSIHGDAEDNFDARYDTSSWLNLARHPSGDFIVGGLLWGSASFSGPTLGSRGKSDFMAVRLDSNGVFQAGRVWGSSGTELLHDIAVAPDGDVVFTGRFWSGPIDFGEAGQARDLGSNSEAVVVKTGL